MFNIRVLEDLYGEMFQNFNIQVVQTNFAFFRSHFEEWVSARHSCRIFYLYIYIYIGFINGKACYKIVNTAHIPLFTIAN